MNINKILISLISLSFFVGCSPEDDIQTPNLIPVVLNEDFSSITADGQALVLSGWVNFAEAGTIKWNQGIYYSDKYAEYSAYQGGIANAISIAWLISPEIDFTQSQYPKMAFVTAQAYVSTSANSLELLVSTDFDGTNVLDATWTPVAFNLAPLVYESNFDFFNSGVVDLSAFKGQKVHIAFKSKGSATDTNLDGTYELDNIRVYDRK